MLVLTGAGDQRRHHAVVHVVVEGDERAGVPARDGHGLRRPAAVLLLVASVLLLLVARMMLLLLVVLIGRDGAGRPGARGATRR